MTPEEALKNVLDTLAGADGCGRYVRFRRYFDLRLVQAAHGNEAAQKDLAIVQAFSDLLDEADRRYRV